MPDYRLLVAQQQSLGPPGVFLNGHCGSSPLGIPTSTSQSPHQHVRPTVDLHLLGYQGPLGKNLSEVQKVLQIVDSTVSRAKVDGNPAEVSKLRAYMKELGAQMEEQNKVQSHFPVTGPGHPGKNLGEHTLESNQADSLKYDSGKQEEVRKLRASSNLSCEEKQPGDGFLSFCCQFCRESFPGPIPLHQHERYLCKMNEDIKAVLHPAGSSPAQTDSPVHHFKDHVSALKAYFANNTEPDSEELLKISMAIGLPQEFVQEWFSQWHRQNHPVGGLLSETSPLGTDSVTAADLQRSFSCDDSAHRSPKASRLQNSVDHLRNDTPSPLNLSSTSSKTSQVSSYTPNSLVSEETPLDLSLPKHSVQRFPSELERPTKVFLTGTSVEILESRPMDLISIKKEVLGPEGGIDSIHQLEKSNSPVFGINPFGPVYTSLPPHGAFSSPTFMSPAQATIPSLRPYASLDTIGLLPHMAYTYATGASTFAEMHQRRKYQRKTAFQVKTALLLLSSEPTD